MSVPTTQWNPFTNNIDYLNNAGGGGGGGVLSWTDINSTPFTIIPDKGYTADSGSQVDFVLPTICTYGKVFRIAGKGSGGWKISQNAGQVIHIGIVNTTVGVTGSIASTHQYDCIEVLCTVANTEFTVISAPVGNLTVT